MKWLEEFKVRLTGISRGRRRELFFAVVQSCILLGAAYFAERVKDYVKTEFPNVFVGALLFFGFVIVVYLFIRSIVRLLAVFMKTMATPAASREIWSGVGAVVMTMVVFAVAHYYIALLSPKTAYTGLNVGPKDGWREQSVMEKLAYDSDATTVIDCMYFSAVTTATVGYGDMAPVSPLARAVTTFQIAWSFVLIAVVLARVIGAAAAQPART